MPTAMKNILFWDTEQSYVKFEINNVILGVCILIVIIENNFEQRI